MHIDCVSFIKFTIFMKHIFSSPTNTGSPNQIQRWPSENWGTHTEIVSFGNVLLLFISLRLRGNTSDQPGLSNTPWYYFFFLSSDLSGKYILYCASQDTIILVMKKEQFAAPSIQYAHEGHMKRSCGKTFNIRTLLFLLHPLKTLVSPFSLLMCSRHYMYFKYKKGVFSFEFN